MKTVYRRKESSLSEEREHHAHSNVSTHRQQGEDYQEEEQVEIYADSILAGSRVRNLSANSSTKTKCKVVFNISETQYSVVKHIGTKILQYRVTSEPGNEWDVFWTDRAVQPETLSRMRPYQKINHFPGMYSLARKNHLGKNLMKMKKLFPESFQFFPQTFLLPAEYNEFKAQFSDKNKLNTFIVKPEASCQGRGIFLTKTWEDVHPNEHCVAQRYLHQPFLLDGLKFDLRIYVLLAGCDPLRIYLFNDGLVRFATEEYIAPSQANLDNMCMHLTNYAINKNNPNFVFNESNTNNNVGHKRSLKAVFKLLEEKGHDVKALWSEIKKIIIKTFCSAQPILSHTYKSCQPNDQNNNMCFEVLGFDIMLDQNLKPWLLEINHTPSFTTDTPLDKNIKQNVITDALRLLNISTGPRIAYKNKRKTELQQGVFSGKKSRLTPEEKAALSQKAQQERDDWEFNHLGNYERVFPLENPEEADEDYEEFLRAARRNWEGYSGIAAAERSRSAKRTTAPVVAKAPIVMPTATSIIASALNQMSRTKQIQAIYSQKLIVGSSNKRASSSQGSRKRPDALLMMKGKQNESVIQESLDTSKIQPKIKGALVSKNHHDIPQLPLNRNYFNSHVSDKMKNGAEKGESEYFDLLREEVYDDPNDHYVYHNRIGEDQFDHANAQPESETSMNGSAEKYLHESGNSLQMEDDNQMPSHREQPVILPTKAKKPQPEEVIRVVPKIRPSTAQKKEPTTYYYKRAETPVSYNKLPFPFKQESLTFIKSPKDRNTYTIPLKEKFLSKPPVKTRKGQPDGVQDFTDMLLSSSSIINMDKQAKSFNFGNNRKLISRKSELGTSSQSTRMVALLADQQKNMNINYLALKTLESNVQTPNHNAPSHNEAHKLNGQFSGSKLYSKILNKSSKIQNDVRIQDYF